MRKRIEIIMVGKAIQTIEGFEKIYRTMQQQTVLRVKPVSREIALLDFPFFFNCRILLICNIVIGLFPIGN
ncbi:MAG: hypothetical protein KKA07_00170 [Bacteroidetes bacterium]|nr:hypothetical protein [Bacteroidota bacterium]